MADPAGTHSDGAIPWGSQVLLINTVNYIADDISVEYDSEAFQSKNESGVITREVLIEMPFKGTATLQLATNTTPLPTIGLTVPITGVNAVALSAKVTKVSPAWKQDGETLVNISFSKKLN